MTANQKLLVGAIIAAIGFILNNVGALGLPAPWPVVVNLVLGAAIAGLTFYMQSGKVQEDHPAVQAVVEKAVQAAAAQQKQVAGPASGRW